jgi:pimeloyl-ACP methyl ester carboxylesterase
MTPLAERGFLDLPPLRLEYRMVGPPPDVVPTLVLLHQGLGSASMWGDFPERLAAATGFCVFAYSREGYGHSSSAPLPRALDFMHREAREVLPRVLDAIGFRQGILVGHSDGASIAAIYAGSVQDHRVCGIAMMAPHFVVEDVTMAAVRGIRQAFDAGEVRFERWHADPAATVRGWSDVRLTNDVSRWDLSEDLAYIRVPILIIQGEQDTFGTMRQIEIAHEECFCPVEVLMLPDVGHIPHREAPEATLGAIGDFCGRLLEHDPEKWVPVFGKDHAQSKN